MALITKTLNNIKSVPSKMNLFSFLVPESLMNSSIRTTFILRRRQPPEAPRKGFKKSNMHLKGRHYEYILIENTNTIRAPDEKFILKDYVEDIGQKGDIISMHPLKAYNNLILPGLADFATPENLEKALTAVPSKSEQKFSTITAPEVKRIIEVHTILPVKMNKEQPWTVEPWHIRASCRQVGLLLGSNECVEIPHEIKGPNLDLEGKEFYVTIKINNSEKAILRCRLHHWSTSPFDRIPWDDNFWMQTASPIFPEDAELLSSMPLPPLKRVIKPKIW